MMKPSPARNKFAVGHRQRAEKAGRRAEFWVGIYLRLQGYSITATRVKTPVGEIDLIARRGALTLFVEVKARKNRAAERTALESVNQHRIVRAAFYYLARHPHLSDRDLRFDVIFLAPFAWPRHVRNAFEAN